MAVPDNRPVQGRRILRFFFCWFPVIAVMAGIFTASHLPARDIPRIFSFQDVVFHAIIYALLGLCFYRALHFTFPGGALALMILTSVLFGFAYGVTDEVHQYFVPGRSSSAADVLTDTIGSCCGAIAAAAIYYGKNKTF